MLQKKPEICIRLRVLNTQRRPLGGHVDIAVRARHARKSLVIRNADASRDIDIKLNRSGLYHLTVTPIDVHKPVSRTIAVREGGSLTLALIVDKGAGGAAPAPPEGPAYKVFGTVRDALNNPLAGTTVAAFDQDIRGEQPLGQPATTDASGAYQITYAERDFAQTDLTAADVFVRVMGSDGAVQKQSQVYFNAPPSLQVDIDLSGAAYAGPSEFEQVVDGVTPYIGSLALSDLTENSTTQDITFLTTKTGLPRNRVEALALAYRFEKSMAVPAAAFYGLILQAPSNSTLVQPTAASSAADFDSKAQFTLAAIMRQDIGALMSSLGAAVSANIVPFRLNGDLDSIRRELVAAQQRYNQDNPQPTAPNNLSFKLAIAGLQGDQVAAFKDLFSTTATGATPQDFWTALANNPNFQAQKISLLQSVFQLSHLTGEQMVLTDQLIEAQKIQTPADLPKLAANTSADWQTILSNGKIQPPAGTPGDSQADQLANYAAALEQNFTAAFPTPAFAARIKSDANSTIPNAGAISDFLAANADFDLLNTRVGGYLANKAAARVSAATSGDIASHLKKAQRVFKLTPNYASSNLLLGDNIDSAHKIYRMGEKNFVAKYGPQFGEAEAERIHHKASKAHAQAVALTGNLKSLSDASHMNVFPNYTKVIADAMTVEVPNLDALFGHVDFCECEECRSVYGAAAYLTDILNFLEARVTLIPCAAGKNASVAEALLRRRPDLADIDLNCDNANIAFPYIDIANEIMEDFIAPPVVTIDISLLGSLATNPIDGTLCSTIVSAFQATNQNNVGVLLTTKASVSAKYSIERLRNDDTCVIEDHWIIRDQFVVLKVTDQKTVIEVRLLHQTLLAADEINAIPEYVNVPAYLKLQADKRPFALPFDFFEAEGEIYLGALGTTKADLADTFRPEPKPAAPPAPATQSDLDVAFAYLGVNEAERALIFQSDTVDQTPYWGPFAAGTSVELDVFMNITGLAYDQVLELLTLQTINPALDSVIVSDDLSCDTDKKQVNNLTIGKFDIIHRFLRLWKKTSLSLEELDAVVQSPKLGTGTITSDLAWKLHRFLVMQKLWSFSVFQYLALFQNMDIVGDDSLYAGLFQNRAVTNPLDADFVVATVTGAPVVITAKHKALLTGALGLAPADLDLVVAQTDKLLSLHNISYFYRVAQLIQALSISVGDLMVYLDILNVSPFGDPVTTASFYGLWRTVIASQFGADDLNYLLRHQGITIGSLVPSDDAVAVALADLQDKILKVRAAVPVSPGIPADPVGQLLKKWLTDQLLNWNAALVAKLADILGTQDDEEFVQKVQNNYDFLLNLRVQYNDQVLTADLSLLPVTIPDTLAAQVSFDSAALKLKLAGYMSATNQAQLKTLAGATAAYQAAVDQLFNTAQQTSSASANLFFATQNDVDTKLGTLLSDNIPERYALFLGIIAPNYRTLQQQSAVQNELCGWFKINKDVAAAIQASQPAIYGDLTADAFVTKTQPLTAANFPNQFNWYQKIAKICFVVVKLKLSADDLAWFQAHAAEVGSLDLWNLPIAPVSGPVSTFAAFQVLVNILKFEQQYPAVTQSTAALTNTISVYTVFGDAIAAAPIATIEADLAALTGWNPAELDALVNAPNYLNVSSPADFKIIRILSRLSQCFAAMTKIGATAADCVAWIKPSIAPDDADKIVQTLKARYPQDQWVSVSQPLQNNLRQAKRDALVAHLLANPPAGQNWQTSDDLYNYFLIDVEMMACQATSRIVQATNSVQQFVQRCFLNLEPKIVIDLEADADWSYWQWMKYFRLWQTNRKVFLYPENWIEPELLPSDIKSSFLADLENDLLQNDVTRANVESAFLNYLDKLDAVARLEIKSMWYEDDKKTIHVVGRTYGGDAKTYYYRTFVEDRRWTPWIKIDQDIASDHIVLTVFNHRIYLFWAVFTEKSLELTKATVPPLPGSSPTTVKLDHPPKYWQIQLAFTEYKNGKWTPKKVSNADASGIITVNQDWDDNIQDPVTGEYGTYIPLKADFLFTPLDIPSIDFVNALLDKNGNPKDPKNFLSAFLKGLQDALSGNGDLRINCYRQYGANGFGYEGTFDLDPCRGYPIATQNWASLEMQLFDRSQMANMLDTEQSGYSSDDSLAVKSLEILGDTPGTFANLIPMQMGFLDRLINIIYQVVLDIYYKQEFFAAGDRGVPITVGTFMPYFYQDQSRTYFAQPEISDGGDFEFTYQDLEDLLLAVLESNTKTVSDILGTFPKGKSLWLLVHFYNFYHPLACSFFRILFDQGIEALMSRQTQLQGDIVFDPDPNKFDFATTYQPSVWVYRGTPATYTGPNGPVTDPSPGYPKGDVEFDPKDGYGLYNWELFYHAPLMIAERLSQNLQFEDADRWFKYIFNPTDGSSYPSPDKFWVTKPFFINVNDKYLQQDITNIMLGINAKDSALVKDVTDWQNNPFQPHYIAQYRTVAYQKTAVMKYLDHLIAWADNLYLQDTMETVMEAEQLYILADQILGPKPLIIPTSYQTPVDNFGQLAQKDALDAFSNAMVDIENLLPLQQVTGFSNGGQQNLPQLETLYFCIPPNDKLLTYWDTVASRLYNIRHCLNLAGQYAPLALFAPPIDPGLLVRAAAAGLDIGSILADMNSPLPNYRFAVMVQKTIELCNEVKSLGGSLLQAMEKKDAEDLALLRSKNGVALAKAVLLIKQQQVEEATRSLEGLQQQQAMVQTKVDYYQGLINSGLNSWENASLSLTKTAIDGDNAAVQIEYLGNILGLIPDFDIGAEGFGGSPAATVKFGGTQLGGATRAIAAAIRGTAGVMHSQAGVATTQGGFARRAQEWQNQLNLANVEMQQVQKQILAATVRQSIANQEVANQQLQIDNAQSEDDFMHGKFTNSDLYAYMIGQLSRTYFQSYQLAYAMAKQTEQTFRYELGIADSGYINFGYWNSLRKGLLAGEQLTYDVHTMEKAYRDQNVRELELTKHVALSQLDASALEILKTSRSCWINLPEELFDMDYPGHYMRRIKTVSVTIPCVAGPYTTVSCTLTLTKNSARVNNSSGVAYPRKTGTGGIPADDPRFRDSVAAIQSIATSTAQNDDGLFELNLRDERYLPFEGAGAISQWHLQMPAGVAQFDPGTITEVILHLKFTARDGGESLRADASTSLQTQINSMLVGLKDKGLARLFSARHDFPSQWYAFLNAPAGVDQVLTLDLSLDRFPYYASLASALKIKQIELVADAATLAQAIQVTPVPATPSSPLKFTNDGVYAGMQRLVLGYPSGHDGDTWTITNPKANTPFNADAIEDLVVIVHYAVTLP
jgi:hypothetical protein